MLQSETGELTTGKRLTSYPDPSEACLAGLDELLARLDLDQPFPAAADGPRGRQGSPQARVHLPEGWLDDPDSLVVPEGAELDAGGG